jgi:hypothetical protein
MTRRWILLLVALPIVYTAAALAFVALNRRGGREPIVLSSREVLLSLRNDDDSAARISLIWHRGPFEGDTWFGREKLRELGFDVSVDPQSPDAERHYRLALPRRAFVAFELDGPAWQAWLAEQERQDASAALRDEFRRTWSRLVPVDAARDADALMARYSDARTHLIAAAVVQLSRIAPPRETPFLSGIVANIDPVRIRVPRDLASRFPPQESRAALGYSVSLRYGRRWEPFVVDVR